MEIEEKIREIEEEIRKTPYNKATQHHIGILKAKLAKLREEVEKKSKKKSGKGYSVKKHGDGTVIIVGPPSVGKSTLLNALTNADSRVGAYDFTTLDVIPGMLDYNGIHVQLIDIPGIISGAINGKGRGKEILSVVRAADLILIMGETKEQVDKTSDELNNAGIRLNKEPPDIRIRKKDTGGIHIVYANIPKEKRLSNDTIKKIVNSYGYHNADITINEAVDVEGFLDALLKPSRKFVPAIVVITKIDKKKKDDLERLKKTFPDGVFVSAKTKEGLDELKKKMIKRLKLIRVYTKKIGERPNLEEPMVLKKGNTVEDMCKRIHKDFVKKFKYARVWGKSVKFDGQLVGLKHRLKDGDVVELYIRK